VDEAYGNTDARVVEVAKYLAALGVEEEVIAPEASKEAIMLA
jgi:hypothetical protein